MTSNMAWQCGSNSMPSIDGIAANIRDETVAVPHTIVADRALAISWIIQTLVNHGWFRIAEAANLPRRHDEVSDQLWTKVSAIFDQTIATRDKRAHSRSSPVDASDGKLI
jgi:hypothetical protein